MPCKYQSTVCLICEQNYILQMPEVTRFLLTYLQCSAIGASFCYLLSYLVGRKIVKKYIPERAAEWKEKVCIDRCCFERKSLILSFKQ